MWDVAARYSGEFNGFKLAVAAAYNDVSSGPCNGLRRHGRYWLRTLRAWHRPWRLQQPRWAVGSDGVGCHLLPGWCLRRARADRALGSMSPTGISTKTSFVASVSIELLPEQDTWYFKAGLRERWHPLGHTVLYGEYETVSDALPSPTVATSDCGVLVLCRKSMPPLCRCGFPTATSKLMITMPGCHRQPSAPVELRSSTSRVAL